MIENKNLNPFWPDKNNFKDDENFKFATKLSTNQQKEWNFFHQLLISDDNEELFEVMKNVTFEERMKRLKEINKKREELLKEGLVFLSTEYILN